jgi:hypothetical protein
LSKYVYTTTPKAVLIQAKLKKLRKFANNPSVKKDMSAKLSKLEQIKGENERRL